LKAAALYFDKLVILDLVGMSWATIEADHQDREKQEVVKLTL